MSARIEKIDGDVTSRIRVLMKGSLGPVMNDLGLSVDIGKIRYSPSTMRIEVNMTLVGAEEDPADKAAANKVLFERYIRKYGGEPNMFGMSIAISGTRYVVSGIKPNARKNAIIITRMNDDREFVCSMETVKNAIKNGTAIMADPS